MGLAMAMAKAAVAAEALRATMVPHATASPVVAAAAARAANEGSISPLARSAQAQAPRRPHASI